jgi:hypothetical protein
MSCILVNVTPDKTHTCCDPHSMTCGLWVWVRDRCPKVLAGYLCGSLSTHQGTNWIVFQACPLCSPLMIRKSKLWNKYMKLWDLLTNFKHLRTTWDNWHRSRTTDNGEGQLTWEQDNYGSGTTDKGAEKPCEWDNDGSRTTHTGVGSVLRSSLVWFLDHDGPQLQPQPVGTASSYLCNQTEPPRTSSYQSGCGSSTDLNQSHQGPVETSCCQSSHWSEPVLQYIKSTLLTNFYFVLNQTNYMTPCKQVLTAVTGCWMNKKKIQRKTKKCPCHLVWIASGGYAIVVLAATSLLPCCLLSLHCCCPHIMVVPICSLVFVVPVCSQMFVVPVFSLVLVVPVLLPSHSWLSLH